MSGRIKGVTDYRLSMYGLTGEGISYYDSLDQLFLPWETLHSNKSMMKLIEHIIDLYKGVPNETSTEM